MPTSIGPSGSPVPVSSKQRQITEDLLRLVRTGVLKPGEQLPGIGRLRKQYGVSQATVEEVIRGFVRRGLVTVERRRGCFISERPLPAEAWLSADPPEAPRPPPRMDLGYYIRPKAGRGTLNVYLTELFPRNLRLWHDELASLGLDRVEIFSCADGHVQDLWRQQRIDLVLANPHVMRAIGFEQFLPIAAGAGIEPQRCLPIVREAVEQGEAIPGAPFALVLQHLFVNGALAAEMGITAADQDTIPALLRAARRVQPALRRQDRHALRVVGGLHDLLIAGGALSCDRDGRFSLAEEIALPLLRELAGSGLDTSGIDELGSFALGQMLFLVHCSYQAVDFAARAAFTPVVRPLPMAAGAMVPAEVMMLAVNRDTPAPEVALEAIRHLLSTEVQARFGAIGGNLPVVAEAALAGSTLDSHPAGRDGLLRQLASSTLRWPARSRHAASTDLYLHHETQALVAGSAAPEQILARIRTIIGRIHAG